jgi:hypothetical protein
MTARHLEVPGIRKGSTAGIATNPKIKLVAVQPVDWMGKTRW